MKRRALVLLSAAVLATGVSVARSRAGEPAAKPVVVLDTSLGEIHVELDPVKAPVTTKNFLDYVGAKHYDGLVFHRVIPTFMIQGGGMDAKLKERKTREPIKNEAANGLKNERGTIAMARTSDPDSATSQFFINVKDNSANLGPGGVDAFGYAVFGKVVKGMDVVDKIKAVKTETQDFYDDVPVTPVVIKTAKLKPAAKAETK
jgi:peptidyl-prolyl cis-trans isomerase A (cyclophilin A)